jgi:hypothetical protein
MYPALKLLLVPDRKQRKKNIEKKYLREKKIWGKQAGNKEKWAWENQSREA